MDISFRQLKGSELEVAYGVLVGAVDWLLSKGIRQWTRPYPRHLYEDAQRKGENYGLFCGDELLVVGTLHRCTYEEWKEEMGTEPRWWLSRLAVRPDRHGEGLGHRAVDEVIQHLLKQRVSELWLDCVEGRLPSLYEASGFKPIATKAVVYLRGTLNMVLMKYELQSM